MAEGEGQVGFRMQSEGRARAEHLLMDVGVEREELRTILRSEAGSTGWGSAIFGAGVDMGGGWAVALSDTHVSDLGS